MDIQQIRQQCKATSKLVHFNNAGAALSPEAVTSAVLDYLRLEQRVGGYEAAHTKATELDAFYASMAELLHCQPDEIAFVENATRAWDQAIYAVRWQAGDEILTGEMEYASNYMGLLHLQKQTGIKIRLIPSDDQGQIDLARLSAAITPRSRMIALTHIASQCGDIQPAAEVGRIAQEHGLYFLLDACQSTGQLDLDVNALHCDFLCGTGRKYLRGPRGTGFLYVRASKLPDLQPIFVDLHAAKWTAANSYELQANASQFENFERFVAGQLGLAVAVDYALQIGLESIAERIQLLVNKTVSALDDLPDIKIHERSMQRSGIITLSRQQEPASALHARLAGAGINTSIVKAANTRLDTQINGQQDRLRASLHYYNSEEEIERFVRVLGAH